MGKACTLNVLFQKFSPFLNLQPTKHYKQLMKTTKREKKYNTKLGNSVDGNLKQLYMGGENSLSHPEGRAPGFPVERVGHIHDGHERQWPLACFSPGMTGWSPFTLLPGVQFTCQMQSGWELTYSHKGTLISGFPTLGD